jgi:UDP-N-acetylbacillosamine N-acetyltransferase
LSKISVIGFGGHTKSLINILLTTSKYQKISIYDDSFSVDIQETINLIPLVGTIDKVTEDQDIVLSIGDNILRKKYFKYFEKQVIRNSLFHRTSFQEKDANIGNSNQIFANSYINSQVIIGKNNIINSGAIIEHGSEIGSHNHISVGVKICGKVNIGDSCFIGAGAVIIDKISICSNVIIGAGSVVINNITIAGTYVGNPVRKIK